MSEVVPPYYTNTHRIRAVGFVLTPRTYLSKHDGHSVHILHYAWIYATFDSRNRSIASVQRPILPSLGKSRSSPTRNAFGRGVGTRTYAKRSRPGAGEHGKNEGDFRERCQPPINSNEVGRRNCKDWNRIQIDE